MEKTTLTIGLIITIFGLFSMASGSSAGVTPFFLGIIILIVGAFIPSDKKKK